MQKKYQSEKGVSILLSVMILSVVLSIALGTSNIAIRQSQSMEGIGDSIIALYAADHGIEEAMMLETPTSTESVDLTNGASYYINVVESSESTCDADHYCITAIGSYKQTKRAIEVFY